MRFKRFLSITLATVAMAFATPSGAGELYAGLSGTAEVENLGDYTDTLAARIGVGYKSDSGYRIAGEYDLGDGQNTAVALVGYAEFGDGPLKPLIGLGAGSEMNVTDFSFRNPFAEAAGGVAYYFNPNVSLEMKVMYRAAIDNLGDGVPIGDVTLNVSF